MLTYFLFRFFTFFSILVVNLFLSVNFSYFFIEDTSHHLVENYFWMTAVYLIAYYGYRLMTRRMVSTNEFMIILKANILALLGIFFVIFTAKIGEEVSRTIVLFYFFINGFNPIWSYLIKKFALRIKSLRRPVFVICDNQGLENVLRWFDEGNPFGYDIELILNVDELKITDIHNRLNSIIENDKYDSAVIDFDSNNIYELNDLVDHIQKNMQRVIILPKISKMPMLNGELISSIHHKGMAFYVRNNLLNPFDQVLKLSFDFILALVLICVFSPILFLLYVIVFVSTNGRPIFTHERIGFAGKRFKVYKFRTMFLDSDERLSEILENCEDCKEEWERDFKLKNDPRITKIGKFLRKTSLDELPQLINVLRGEMSLVGPRPIVQDEILKYGEYFDYFILVKPGITGLWQVSGRNDIDYDERVQLDVWYVKNWSVELDIQILLKTILVVLNKKGSY